jgi:hypothetical protein
MLSYVFISFHGYQCFLLPSLTCVLPLSQPLRNLKRKQPEDHSPSTLKNPLANNAANTSVTAVADLTAEV